MRHHKIMTCQLLKTFKEQSVTYQKVHDSPCSRSGDISFWNKMVDHHLYQLLVHHILMNWLVFLCEENYIVCICAAIKVINCGGLIFKKIHHNRSSPHSVSGVIKTHTLSPLLPIMQPFGFYSLNLLKLFLYLRLNNPSLEHSLEFLICSL